MEYHFLRYKFYRNNYFLNMFDILLERGINSLCVIEIDWGIIEIDIIE